jgi:hypothetical protein
MDETPVKKTKEAAHPAPASTSHTIAKKHEKVHRAEARESVDSLPAIPAAGPPAIAPASPSSDAIDPAPVEDFDPLTGQK